MFLEGEGVLRFWHTPFSEHTWILQFHGVTICAICNIQRIILLTGAVSDTEIVHPKRAEVLCLCLGTVFWLFVLWMDCAGTLSQESES